MPDYLEPYQKALDTHGPGFEATLWCSRRAQLVRFDVLLDMVDLTDLRLVDAGCGMGDLAAYVNNVKKIKLERYIGVDGLAEVIAGAKTRKLDNTEFIAADFVAQPRVLATGQPHVIFFSGSLNTVAESQARKIIYEAYNITENAVVFNFLSDKCNSETAAKDTGPASRFDTLDWIKWSLSVTPIVRFRQDYLAGHDATIAMYKPM